MAYPSGPSEILPQHSNTDTTHAPFLQRQSPSPEPEPESFKMETSGPQRRRGFSAILVGSYALDWLVVIAMGVGSWFMGHTPPNKRHFSLQDPNISFPYTVNETVPSLALLFAGSAVPILTILFVALVLVPGRTVPRGTPSLLIWKRKLWELHVGWLGLALALASAWFFTNGMKNMFGKPRPDLISRCQPDLSNVTQYIVGGVRTVNELGLGTLVSADICTNPDKEMLDDGFRSFPSGHSSSSAAGLIYLSLFLASKFAVTIPFLAPTGYSHDEASFSAFPSRLTRTGSGSSGRQRIVSHQKVVTAARRQAAAPPLYLLLLTLLPFFGAIFIASSRWFDFRHHGFDILFGFAIGTITSIFSFRYYHLPISYGAGWAWAPRSRDKAFWAGVGSYSYATDKMDVDRIADEESALESTSMSVAMERLRGVRSRSS